MIINFSSGAMGPGDLGTGGAWTSTPAPAPAPTTWQPPTISLPTYTPPTAPAPDLAAIQTQLNSATAGATAAQQYAAQAMSAARLVNVPAALGYASAAANLAQQAQVVLQTARAAAGKRDLQGTTIAAGQILTIAEQTRGQADLANQAANAGMRGGVADPFAPTSDTSVETMTGVASAPPPGGAAISSRAGGGSGPRYVESGDEPEGGAVSSGAPLAPSIEPARPYSPVLIYGAIAAVAYFWARG